MDEKGAVIYLRTSGETLKSNAGFGMQIQKTDCENYCRDHGLEIDKTFVDDGVSGSDEALEKSHALLELLSYLNGEDLVIVTKHSDRICGRGEYRAAWVRREIIKSGKKLVCTDQLDYDIYSDDPASVLMKNLFDAISLYERMNTSLRLAKSRRAKVRGGMKASGRAPYGYSWESVWTEKGKTKELMFFEPEADCVRDIFKKATMGLSCGQIGSFLYQEHEVKMSRSKIYGILTNEAYIGKMKYGETESMNENLALIPKITFGKAQAALARRRKGRE